MKRKTITMLLCVAAMTVNAQVALMGIGHSNRYDDGDQTIGDRVHYILVSVTEADPD